jgi:glucokinase
MKLGVDLGGTNLRAAVFDDIGDAPREVHKERVGDDRDPEAIVSRIAELVTRFAGDATAVPVGVGIAAMLRDRRGTVANSPHLRWRDVAFGALLAKRLGSRFRVGIYNDVNAVVWGESVAGSARGCRDVLGVYIGTGIGGGVISGGQLVEGTSNCAGEIGHAKIRWDDAAEPCACGQRGCIEAYVGGSYVQRRIHAELAKRPKALPVQLAGKVEDVTPSHVDTAAASGDEWSLALWTELSTLFAVVLANTLAVLNSERLVLGGGLLGRAPTLYELVETALMVAAPVATTEALTVVAATLGDDAGLVGAAALAASGVSIID